jgi:3-hydroxyisobutyrate dehydrogenase-like beta-hydroxyacid dehydrogenase
MADDRIGFVGLGTMGAAMTANLARAGFAVTAWNRSPAASCSSTTMRHSESLFTSRPSHRQIDGWNFHREQQSP